MSLCEGRLRFFAAVPIINNSTGIVMSSSFEQYLFSYSCQLYTCLLIWNLYNSRLRLRMNRAISSFPHMPSNIIFICTLQYLPRLPQYILIITLPGSPFHWFACCISKIIFPLPLLYTSLENLTSELTTDSLSGLIFKTIYSYGLK